MKLLFLNTLIMIILFVNIGYTQDFWTPLGAPADNVVYSFASSANGTLYMGTYCCGLYRLLPGSSNWVLIGLPDFQVCSIEVTPDGDIIAGTEQIIYKSADDGITWTSVFESYAGKWITIKAFGNGLIYAGDTRGRIVKSTDNGETWEQLWASLRIEKHISDLAMGPDGAIYAAVLDEQYGQGGIFREDYDGWECLGMVNLSTKSVKVTSSGEILACGNHGIYKYSGVGTSWTLIYNMIGMQSLYINPEGVIFAANQDPSFSSGGVLRSQDNGLNFEPVNSGLTWNSAEKLDMDDAGYLYTYTNFSSSMASVFKTTLSTLTTNLLSGVIQYSNPAETPLDNIQLDLLQQDSIIRNTVSDLTGHYYFSNLQSGLYTLSPSTSKPWGGVTALDVLLFQKHIAGISPLSGIYLAAGDVDGSGTLSAVDLLLIKKRIAGISNSFPVSDWLFNNEPVTINQSNVIYNFNGICFGDANGSYVPPIK